MEASGPEIYEILEEIVLLTKPLVGVMETMSQW